MFDTTRQYELTVRPLGRKPADEYYHNGAIWVEGREGNSYTIDLTNRSNRRALFILSVDGLDVLKGKPAGLESQGYVIPAGQTISVPGWKVNDQQAAEFFFSRSRESYVNSIGGSTTNTGVIGAMVFQEYQDPALSPFDISRYYSGNSTNHNTRMYSPIVLNNTWINNSVSAGTPINSATVQAAVANNAMNEAYNCVSEVKTSGGILSQNYVSQEVGTGFGNATEWQTVSTQFRRNNQTQPDCILAIYYNTARNLEKMGIKLRRKRDVEYKADPFPAYSTPSGCKPPEGWNG